MVDVPDYQIMEDLDYGFKYLITIPGILKISEVICCGIAILCSMVFDKSWSTASINFFNVLVIVSLVYCLIEIILHIMHVVRTFNPKTYRKYDCIFAIIASVCLCSTTASIMIYYTKPASLEAAIVFGFFSGIVFIANAVYRVLYL